MAIDALRAQEVKSNFSCNLLCTNFNMMKTKANKPYVTFTAQDEDGQLTSNNWDYALDKTPVNGVYKLTGNVDTFNGSVQLNVKTMALDNEANLTDYTVRLLNSAEYLDYIGRLKGLIDLIDVPIIKKIVNDVYKDFGLYSDNPELSPLYMTAALMYHHVGLGGFIKHTVDTAVKAYHASNGYYSSTLKSFVVAGALLHDIGKLITYTLKDGGFAMTQRGENLDHIVLGYGILERYLTEENEGAILVLQQIIISHHSLPEWGSPKKPMSIEAHIVATADYGDCLEFVTLQAQKEKPDHVDLFKNFNKERIYGYKGISNLLDNGLRKEFAEAYHKENYEARLAVEKMFLSEDGNKPTSIDGAKPSSIDTDPSERFYCG